MAQRPYSEPSRLSDDDYEEDDGIEVHTHRRCKYATNEKVSKWSEDEYGHRFYTKKHLVRDCYCEEFTDRAYLLNKNGKDGEGYEIHKTRGEVLHCKWRKYRMGRKKWALVRKCTCGRYTEGEVSEVNETSRR